MGAENGTAEPIWLSTSDNDWLLTAASLVGLQSILGMAVLYAGIMPKKWAINSAFLVFSGFAITVLCWGLYAYNIAFGEYMLPFAGRPGPMVIINKQLGQSTFPTIPLNQNVPLSSMVYYQFVMAAIAVTILAGPLLGRIDFIAWMGFVFLWITFCYSIGAFSIWGGGFLFRMGVIDYSGGYVIHLSSGVAGFVASWFIGPGARIDNGVDASRPGNLLFAFTGASILWIGSNGFGRGYSYSATADAGVAIWNTNLCTAMSVLCWIVYDKLYFGKLSLLGAIEGMISGLVAIASGAGVVAGWSAVVIGLLCGTITWVSMNVIRRRITLLAQIDDHVGVLHTRCVAAFWGGVCTGIFATVEGCAAFGLENPGGGIDGNGRQVWLQIVGSLFVIGWNFVWTYLILLCIRSLCCPLRMSEEGILVGDQAVHGETV